MGDYTLKGVDEVLGELQKRLGPQRVKTVVSKALRKAGEHVEQDLIQVTYSFNRTGATTNQVVKGNVSWADYGIPKIKIGWRRAGGGESPRWNIEHLNEMGYTRNGRSYSPRGFGKLQGLIDEYEGKYPEIAREELEELVK